MGTDVIILSSEGGMGEARSSFSFSFSFLPKAKREALKTVYTFCRTTDDIVDNNRDLTSNIERLQTWRRELEAALHRNSRYQLLNQLSAVARTFNIPVIHFYELLKGVEMDIMKNRYETFDELRDYCYLVASSVGLMCLGIFGSKDQRTKDYAINLGIALQLTNILRDIGVDARYGRIYLPQEDLHRFRCTEEDVFTHRYTSSFVALMEFESQRAEDYFRKAQELLPEVDKRVMFAAKIMERIYFHTLRRIKKVNFNVLDKPVYLPRTIQFLIAVKYWIKQRIFGK